jgi:hypothetical protein
MANCYIPCVECGSKHFNDGALCYRCRSTPRKTGASEMTPDFIQYTDWWHSGRLWYVMANGHSGAGGTKEQAMADAKRECDRFWQRHRARKANMNPLYTNSVASCALYTTVDGEVNGT